jgi:hypothetical protein
MGAFQNEVTHKIIATKIIFKKSRKNQNIFLASLKELHF